MPNDFDRDDSGRGGVRDTPYSDFDFDAEYDIDNIFMYHAPTIEQVSLYNKLRMAGKEFAQKILDYCPESRERWVALGNVEEAVMWANGAIARQSGRMPDDVVRRAKCLVLEG